MLKKFIKRIRVNFRQSSSDRKATLSYRNYHQRVKQIVRNIIRLPKTNKG